MNYENYSTAVGLAGVLGLSGEQCIEDFGVEESITSSSGVIYGFGKIGNGNATDPLDDVDDVRLTMILSSMFKWH
jgi:hypothetical protein